MYSSLFLGIQLKYMHIMLVRVLALFITEELPVHFVFVCVFRYGASTKAAVIRIGFGEMWKFIQLFDGHDTTALLESCGMADLIATCFGGRNRRVSEAYVNSGKVNTL